MMTYHEVLKVVRPKQKAVEEAEGVLRELRINLREKKDQLTAVEDVIIQQMEQYSRVCSYVVLSKACSNVPRRYWQDKKA